MANYSILAIFLFNFLSSLFVSEAVCGSGGFGGHSPSSSSDWLTSIGDSPELADDTSS